MDKAEFARIRLLLHHTPVEDGISHVGEKLIQRALCDRPDEALDWIIDTLYGLTQSTAAGFLKCLGRIDYEWLAPIAPTLIRFGLSSNCCELREEAIGAIEGWERVHLVEYLLHHKESVQWIEDYKEQVIRDMQGDA